MQAQIGLGNVRLIKPVSRAVVAPPERVDVTRVSANHELQLESPIKTDLRVERAFRCDHGLVHHGLVAPVVKEPAEVLIILRTIDVSGKAAFNPAINSHA